VERKDDGTPVTPSDRLAEEAIREILARATPELGLLGEEWGQDGDERDRWIIDPLDGTKNFIAGLPHFAVLIALELDGDFRLGVVHAPALGPGSGVDALPGPGEGGRAGETWWAARGHGAFGGAGTRDEPDVAWRPLAASTESRMDRAFVAHGGLQRFQHMGLWPEVTDLVATVARTRGFGDFWGHVLVAEGHCDAMVEAAVALHDVAALKVLVEEAGGTFHTRGDAPLTATFNEAVLSANAHLAEELRHLLHFGPPGPLSRGAG